VVDVSYGCGAHSETVVDAPLISASTAAVVDEVTLEVHHRPVVESGPVPEAEPVPDSVPEPGSVSEPAPDVAGTPLSTAW
jgi:hypothetical protein